MKKCYLVLTLVCFIKMYAFNKAQNHNIEKMNKITDTVISPNMKIDEYLIKEYYREHLTKTEEEEDYTLTEKDV